jgi:NSS family neurotransmitter:Na+ symporter
MIGVLPGKGASNGVSQYMTGTSSINVTSTETDQLRAKGLGNSQIWIDAIGQVFFSIGTCMGVMTAYGSYQDERASIVGDGVAVASADTIVSFLSGFVVWGLIGILEVDLPSTENVLDASEASSNALIFVTIPRAINKITGSNAWCFILYLMLLLNGITSAISFIEGVTTTLNDVMFARGCPRAFISLMTCMLGCMISMVYCFNWGFELLDLVDYYINTFLLVFIGIVQCVGCGWAFDFGIAYEKHRYSAGVSMVGYWFCLILISSVTVPNQVAWIGGIVFVASQVIIVNPISYFVSGLTFDKWYRTIFFCGVRKIAYSFTK